MMNKVVERDRMLWTLTSKNMEVHYVAMNHAKKGDF